MGVLLEVINAEIETLQQIKSQKIQDYYLSGFGSSIYNELHNETMLKFRNYIINKNNITKIKKRLEGLKWI